MANKRKNSISSRLMRYFVCIVFFPIAILSLIIYGTYKSGIVSLAQNNAKDSLELLEYNIEQQFLQYDSLAYFISKDVQLQEISRYKNVREFNQDHDVQDTLRRLLQYYQSTAYQVYRVVISYENGILFATDQKTAVGHQPQNQSWYQLCRQEQNSAHFLNYAQNEPVYDGIETANSEHIIVCRSIEDNNGNFIGSISVEMYSQVLEKSTSNILSRNGSYVYIVNSNGKVVYSPVLGKIQEVSDKNYYSVTIFNPRTQWTIVGVVAMDAYWRQLNLLTSVLAITLLIIVLVMALISKKVGNSVVEPIKTLQALMHQAEKGDLSIRFHGEAPKEIQDLGNSFNIMIENLDYSVKQVRIEQKAKRKAEMEALQANIKPHFLYNTLDTIHWMAKAYHAADIVETVDALSTLFRIALSKGSEKIPIYKEIQHVTSYLQIQKIRYEDMISYEISAAQDCKELLVKKLILQPLVENSIYHGIKESGRKGKIFVRVWKDDNAVYLAVEDDGMGMTQERLEKVRESLNHFHPEEGGAYGVVNVHQRLILNYGAPYGLYLESELGEGTTALICHPIL